MDVELAKSLEKLRARKRVLDTESDLTSEYSSIKNLDSRVESLLEDATKLKAGVSSLSDFVQGCCDKLRDNHMELRESSHASELVGQLLMLNDVCRRLSGWLEGPGDSQAGQADGDRQSDSSNRATVEGLARDFRELYGPLEEILSKRLDLPYASLASRLESLGQQTGRHVSE